MPIKKIKRKYTYNKSQERKGSLSHVLVDTLITQNPFYYKYLLDTLIDARNRWIEIETKKLVLARSKMQLYIERPCPITLDTIKWVSKYLRYLNLEKNGNIETDL